MTDHFTPALQKPSMSFFKRPIRMRRDKKAPSALIVDSLPIQFTTSASTPNLPPSILTQNFDQIAIAPSPNISTSTSSTGTRFNSLLTAAARSIRTGDSRLFESFQATLSSPKPTNQFQSLPSLQKNHSRPPGPHSLKRIPVPSYDPIDLQNNPPTEPERLTRTTSLERPKTASKHSRTSSLPYPQAVPEPARPAPSHTRSHQDLRRSLEKLSHTDRQSRSSRIKSISTLSLPQPDQLVRPKSDLFHPSPPLPSISPNFNFFSSRQPKTSNSSTHPIPSNLSFEHSRQIVSKALANSPKPNHVKSTSPSLPCLPQLGSQPPTLAVPRRVSLKSIFSRHSSANLALQPNNLPKSNDSLEPVDNKEPMTVREAQRRSFQNLPLPDLPSPPSPKRKSPPVQVEPSPPKRKSPNPHAFLELPTLPNSKTNRPASRLQTPKKPQRPWSIASPESLNEQSELANSLSISQRSGARFKPFTGGDDKTSSNDSSKSSSPLKNSTYKRPIRYSYPCRSIPDLSPLERVSDQLKSAYSTSSPNARRSQVFNLHISDSGSIGEQAKRAHRLPSSGNLKFGFRGEVYELDKCQKSSVLAQSLKALIDSDHDDRLVSPAPSSHPPSSQKSTRGHMTSKLSDSLGPDDDRRAGSSPTSPTSTDARSSTSKIPKSSLGIRHNIPDLLVRRAAPDFDDVEAEGIELREISLIGSDLALDQLGMNELLNPAEESISIGPSSPRNSDRLNCSTEHALENLSVDRGSSEEEVSRCVDESTKYEFGPEPKIINPETSLEMAASILGQPIPSISKEIREGFERINYLFSNGRPKETIEKDKQEFMTKMLKTIDYQLVGSTKTLDATVQTDPVELVTPRKNSNPSIHPPGSVKINNRRIADTLKKLANRNDHAEHSKENLSFNLTRRSTQSEQSFKSANRSYGVGGGTEDQQESLRSSGGDGRSPRVDHGTERPIWRKQRLSEMSDSNSRLSSWTAHSVQTSQQHSYSPLGRNTGETHLGLQTQTVKLNESVLDALDNALRAEESFKREKEHLQAVARRQSHTIESLLIDKEVLSLEVSRLTGLVELLARDHNLLNERIDLAERAYDPPAQVGGGRRASGTEDGAKDVTAQEKKAVGERWARPGDLTETDDGVMAGDSEEIDDAKDDRESLCDPEQASIHFFNHRPLSLGFAAPPPAASPPTLPPPPLPRSYPQLIPTGARA